MEKLTTAHRAVLLDAQAEFQAVAVESVTTRSQTRALDVQILVTDRTAVVGQSPVTR